jgi:hypothetical protein
MAKCQVITISGQQLLCCVGKLEDDPCNKATEISIPSGIPGEYDSRRLQIAGAAADAVEA